MATPDRAGINAAYMEALYEAFLLNPDSVPEEWRTVFSARSSAAERATPSLPNGVASVPQVLAPATSAADAVGKTRAPESDKRLLSLVARAARLLQAFREHGHQSARIDPLGSDPPGHPQLDPAYFGTTMEELRAIPSSALFAEAGDRPLAAALDQLKATYSGRISYEFEHLEDPRTVEWLWKQVEQGTHFQGYSDEDRLQTLDRLIRVEGLEQFLHKAYMGQKRFSIEGIDMMVPMLDEAIEQAAASGASDIVVGMAHRGRLNVLTHILGVTYEELLGEFEGRQAPGSSLWVPDPGTGDVKYHHGAVGEYSLKGGGSVRVTLAPNPSHLEYVNPVILGMARALQYQDNGVSERDPAKVVPILIHGDAAFAAEGVVAETLNLARLRGYEVGGALHIIANNQVGFTTDPGDGRSTRYASDLAKGYDIPVMHVNGDAPEECLAAVRLAMAYRKEFHGDVVLDLVGYRRHGHNEADEPAYTQPAMYRQIRNHPTPVRRWADFLQSRGAVAKAEVEERASAFQKELYEIQDGFRDSKEPPAALPFTHPDFGVVWADSDPYTQVSLERLEKINRKLLDFPDGFAGHPKLLRQLLRRGDEFGPDFLLDWGHAEALGVASLLEDDIPVRLTGQDSQRGTFSHRHFVLHDVKSGETLTPMERVGDARFEVYNSPLTEAATVGFEYGFAVAANQDLVLWEAQFGDFANVAQVIIDQFLSAGWSKWGQRSRLALLLPHGFEGMGPEHSSARLERFLQLCAEENMRVVYPTTPAQLFHLLRFQAFSEPERPLVVMTGKSLLRHPSATSPVRDLSESGFKRVLDDPRFDEQDIQEEVKRLVLCSGKVYYELAAEAEKAGRTDVAIARIEMLYPFPADETQALEERYPSLETLAWVQEEPWNMGARSHVDPHLRSMFASLYELKFVARPERASPAVGSYADHAKEQRRVVEEALGSA